MSKRYFSLLVTMLVAVVIFATPVFAAEFEEPENLSEELVLCDSDVVEEVSEERVDLLGSEESTPAEESVVGEESALGESEEKASFIPFEDSNSNEDAILGSRLETYYNQPKFKVKDGYDIIMFYISDSSTESSGLYAGKAYFIIDKSKSEKNWMLYNYKEETANQYLVDPVAGDLILPAIKEQTRADSSTTMLIDESRVPIMSKADFDSIYCNWRSFSEIPFKKAADGSLEYALYSVEGSIDAGEDEDDDDKEEEKKKDSSIPSFDSNTADWYRYTVNLKNGNVYRIFVTRSVSYNGKRHVLDTAAPGGKKSNDIQVHVYLNGHYVDPGLYKVQFKNNKNCNGYGGDKNAIPYIKLKFKFKNKDLKWDIKAFERKGFGFDILPLDISKGVISYKSIKNGKLKKATWTGKDGVSINLNPPTRDNGGDYYLRGNTVVGRNNFYGETQLANSASGGDSRIY